jgi:hypothetical protein
MLHTVTGEPPTSLAVRLGGKVEEAPEEPVAQVELVAPVGQEALAELAVRVASGEPVARVASGELAVPVAQVALAELAVPVAQVAAVLGLGQAVVPVHDRVVELELVPVAVALRPKSVTAAHHPDLVPLLEAEEDLAAVVAETMHEPVAAEAAAAWAAAE